MGIFETLLSKVELENPSNVAPQRSSTSTSFSCVGSWRDIKRAVTAMLKGPVDAG